MADLKAHTTITPERLASEDTRRLVENLRKVLADRLNAHFDPEADEAATTEKVKAYVLEQVQALSKLTPLEGLKVESVETTPVQEAVDRLTGEHDPNLVRLNLTLPVKPVEYVRIDFLVEPEHSSAAPRVKVKKP